MESGIVSFMRLFVVSRMFVVAILSLCFVLRFKKIVTFHIMKVSYVTCLKINFIVN
jgi:hypothetical protein